MGWLSWFIGGGNNRTKVTSRDKAILDLKLQRDKVRQYQKRIASVQRRERDLARQCLARGDKEKALLFLRKEKFQKQLLSKTDDQLATLEDLATSIEFALIQKDIYFGLEKGNMVLKEINREMSMDKLEKILDDNEEAQAYQAEVNGMLEGRISRNEELEIEDELAALESEENAGHEALSMPEVPKEAPKGAPKEGASKHKTNVENPEEIGLTHGPIAA